ncbi:PAS domain-containing protein [Algoriphagus sp. CAU 1675]|uniref:PAS domain-containing protein n=1 Tax=Algoriphagus sp. CAU 1675 TaxID=3032597 RepID=UPI0023D9E42B|nr:PAS domain-containing protein [Algoriphagus sp. CAU 1675]MDF2157160.1 PAS domain-containing protein [Algoriphagus sp. CAU 1675]
MAITLDKTGKILSSDSAIGPAPSLFDRKETSIHFSDCFQISDWKKYENARNKARKSSHHSFIIHLKKINYPSKNLIETKWEFFFSDKDSGTCTGIGHPLESSKPYNIELGDFIYSSDTSNELYESILENKLLGFWEYIPSQKSNTISSGLAQSLGYSKSEIENLEQISWERHIHPEDFSELIKELVYHFKYKRNQALKKEFRMINKSKETIWVLCFGKTISWSQEGSPLSVQGILLDITERKKQELWLQEHYYFLKELAFNQSHTLRARVANILGLLEILNAEQQTEESKNIIGILKKETQQLDLALKKSIKESVQQNKTFEKESQFI